MRFYIKRGATLPKLLFQIVDEATGYPVDLTGATVSFKMKRLSDGAVVTNAGATIEQATQGLVSYSWSTNDTQTVGVYIGEFDVAFPDGYVLTVPRKNSLEIWVVDDVI